jgi:hypothetical protein
VRLEAVPGACQVPLNWWIPDWLEGILPRLDVERVAVGTTEGRG